MNERIQELALQAGNYAYKMNPEEDSYGRSANPRKFQQDRDEKFAELIVRECAGVCVEQRQYQPKEVYAQAVLSHFGVEE
jgi:hypothetical protein